ncbi:MAG: putative toxin-antitoxin system toxin component, PIN family [Vicinamibacterales bacterium]
MLDTDVLVAAIRSDRGASRVLLTLALERRYPALVSVPLMIEYEAVLTRPEHLDASGLSSDEMQALLDAVALVAEPVRLSYLWRPSLPDVDDDMVLETAVNGRADMLVTFNRRDFEPLAATFGIVVMTPIEALRRLKKKP